MPTNPDHDFLSGGGGMAERIRGMDWSSTPLGPMDGWPQSLRSALSHLLPSKAQIALFWGPDLITFYNDAYTSILGRKHPVALGAPVREVWAEIWSTTLEALFDSVLTTGEAFWAQDLPFFLERHGYLEETYFDVSYDPMRDESGRVSGVFCIVSETTGRVVGERRLRLLRDVGVVAQQASSVSDVFTTATPILARYPEVFPFALFYARSGDGASAELVGACGVEAGAPVAPRALGAGRQGWPLVPSLEIVGAEAVVPGPVRAGLWPEPIREVAVVPCASGAEPPTSWLVVGISPRRHVDEAKRDFLRVVGSTVGAALAVAQRSEDARRRAEELEALDRAKTTFFSNVSHELRTPLTLMMGPTEDALSSSRRALGGEALEMVHRNELRLLKLVNSLLDFARIEAGRAEASFQRTDLGRVTREVASAFSLAIERAGLDFVVDCASPEQPTYVDRALWEKVVLNLLSNALKFTFTGRITIRLKPSDDHAELQVSDTGTGIPAAELPHIFERFRRVPGSKSRTHEGSGIGLALVSEIVKMHGGTVEARSALGKGTTFTVQLPFGKAHLDPARVDSKGAQASTAVGATAFVAEALRWLPGTALGTDDDETAEVTIRVPPQIANARIIVADDNADMREYLTRLLSKNWRVESVADGLAALEAARRERPDLVLTDVMMPGLDGFGLLRELHADTALASTPVLMLSARAGEEASVEGLQAGADDYLVKPFAARELLARVSTHLQ